MKLTNQLYNSYPIVTRIGGIGNWELTATLKYRSTLTSTGENMTHWSQGYYSIYLDLFSTDESIQAPETENIYSPEISKEYISAFGQLANYYGQLTKEWFGFPAGTICAIMYTGPFQIESNNGQNLELVITIRIKRD